MAPQPPTLCIRQALNNLSRSGLGGYGGISSGSYSAPVLTNSSWMAGTCIALTLSSVPQHSRPRLALLSWRRAGNDHLKAMLEPSKHKLFVLNRTSASGKGFCPSVLCPPSSPQPQATVTHFPDFREGSVFISSLLVPGNHFASHLLG